MNTTSKKFDAENKEFEELYNNGCKFYNGLGVRVNKKEAARFYKINSENLRQFGFIFSFLKESTEKLANMLYYGDGIDQNKHEAAMYYKKLTCEGYEDDMIKYTNMLLNGDGIAQDKEEAAHILRVYANYNSIYAIDKFSSMLLNGDGIKSNPKQAAEYLETKKRLLQSNESFKQNRFHIDF